MEVKVEEVFLHVLDYKTKEIEAFLYELFIYSRPDLTHLVQMDDKLSRSVLENQYMLSELYKDKKEVSSRYLIAYKDRYIGKIYMRHTSEIDELVSIAIMPEYRNRGIGRIVIDKFLDESRAKHKGLRLRVAWYNFQAKELYKRIGFKESVDYDVYCEMECR